MVSLFYNRLTMRSGERIGIYTFSIPMDGKCSNSDFRADVGDAYE